MKNLSTIVAVLGIIVGSYFIFLNFETNHHSNIQILCSCIVIQIGWITCLLANIAENTKNKNQTTV